MSYLEIEYDLLKECNNKRVQYVICANVYNVESHKYKVIRYAAKIGKISTYIIPKYTNCKKNHQIIAFKHPAKLKAKMEIWKKKMKKPQIGEKLPVTNKSPDNKTAARQIDIKVDINIINWAKSSGVQFLGLN